MPAFNVDLNYFDHPKTKRLVRSLGRGADVLPLRLWAFTGRNFAKDGRLTGLTMEDVEAECAWWGKRGEMVRVMLQDATRYIQLDGDTYVVHEWLEYQGHIHAYSERGKVANRARWDRVKSSAGPSGSPSGSPNGSPLTYLSSTTPTKPVSERTRDELLAKESEAGHGAF